MHQFFIEENQIRDGCVRFTGDAAHHIRNVLRMHSGETLRACTAGEKAYLCRIESVAADEVCARIEDLDGTYAELDGTIVLFQGLPKGDKMEMVVRKAVELGAAKIVPTAMTNCVTKLSPDKAKKKVTRWQAIAKSAAQQSKRLFIPQVSGVMDFKEALAMASQYDIVLVPYEMADANAMRLTAQAIAGIRCGMTVGVFIGPEGGFDPKEIAAVREICRDNARIVSLGHRILRTETAALTMLSILMYHFETASDTPAAVK